MNGRNEPADELTPAERRVHEHLILLRADAPQPPPLLARWVVQTARWQRTIRHPLLAIVALAGTIGDGIRLALRPPADRS